MRRWWKWALIAGGVAVLVVTAVLMVRALNAPDYQRSVESVDVQVADLEGAVDRLSAAISYPTISPTEPGDAAPFVEFRQALEKYYPRFHDRATRRLISELTLHYTVEGSAPDGGHVVFLAHQDVVPVEAGTEEEWTHPPFSGAVEGGFVWGRGTLDNKHNLMAMLEAVEAMLEEGFEPEHTLHFVFGHDEEIGGMEGARLVAEEMERRQLDIEAVYDEGLVIADGLVPGIEGPIALVGVTERGYLTVEIEATAVGGHSSMPPDELAVVRLARALDELDANPRPAAIDGPARQMFEWSTSEMDLLHRLIFRNLWLFEPLVVSQMVDSPETNASVRTTAAPTMLRAGQVENVLPQRATATVNFRIHPRDRIDEVLADLEDLIGGEHISIEPVGQIQAEPSPVAATEGPGFEALRLAVGEVFDDVPIAPASLVALTDARHFTGLTDDVYRFHPVILEQEDLARIHGTDERIGVDAYLDLIRYYDRLIRQW